MRSVNWLALVPGELCGQLSAFVKRPPVAAMQFTSRLRGPVARGEITKTIRIWKQPRVRVGNAYRMEEGHVVIDSLHQISFEDITPSIARETGFAGVADLLKTAKHGAGENVYLIEFHYVRE